MVTCCISKAASVYRVRSARIVWTYTSSQGFRNKCVTVMWCAFFRNHRLSSKYNLISCSCSPNLGLIRRACIWCNVYRMVGYLMVNADAFWKAKSICLTLTPPWVDWAVSHHIPGESIYLFIFQRWLFITNSKTCCHITIIECILNIYIAEVWRIKNILLKR